ncbi:MAG: efflux RND transporter periplasmic adaptor subunit [Ancalomicrobiaceae bacterium]|nr:efflux RND transporter periplasmic adaptor subunit [Ancalomicrobiaceae bacterium]
MDDRVGQPILKRDAKRIPPKDALSTHRSAWGTLGKLLVILALAGGGYWIYQRIEARSDQTARTARPLGAPSSVGVATVGTSTIHVYVNALGTVTPLASVTVQTQINGQLQQVAFKEGQTVKKGDFLAQIDSRPYEALKAQYEGQLARDQGLLAQARADNARYQTLLQQNSIARQTAEDQIFVVAQDEGTVRIDQALIDAQKLNIAYCRIVSPIDGRVGLRLVDEGNYVQTSSSTGIAVITETQPISVLFPVTEDALGDIAPQVADGAKLQTTIFDRTNVKQLAAGVVTTLDNQIDTTTGTVKLRAQFDNADNKLFPNQFVNVRLLVTTLDNTITVPGAAIQRGAPGTYVYVVGTDNKVSVRTVTVGPADGDLVAVTTGLSVGDRAVVDGADRLRDGGQVTIAVLDGKPVAARQPKPASAMPGEPQPPASQATPPSTKDETPSATHRRKPNAAPNQQPNTNAN